MKYNVKRATALIVLMVMILFAILPTVQAMYEENTIGNETQLENVTIKGKQEDDQFYQSQNQENYTDFQTVLAGLLNTNKDAKITIEDMKDILNEKPTKNGVWIQQDSREYLVNLINSLTNKIYLTDEDGFLVEDKNITKEEIKEEWKSYTEKIDNMISETKFIAISIDSTYKNLNKIDQDIIDIRIEEDEYALLFMDNNEKERNKEDIIVLNQVKYNISNKENNQNFLMNKLLVKIATLIARLLKNILHI